MRALVRFRWLLPALVLPLGVALTGIGLQAAAFRRPARETLVAADALNELLRYRVMRATEQIGRQRLATVCVQGWYHVHGHLVPGAIVLFSNGERLYDFQNGIRRIGRRGRVGPTDRARFLLAGCPQFMGQRIGIRLLGAKRVDLDPTYADGTAVLTIHFGESRTPVDLYVERKDYRPVELTLSGGPIKGWSDLRPGGNHALIVRVRRAFHVRMRPRVRSV